MTALEADVLGAGQRRPALAQGIGGGFGPPVPGEDALLVAVHAHDAVGGLEVREVPDLLPHHGVDAVEDPVVHGQERGLVFLAPGLFIDGVEAGHGVRSVLGHDHGLAVLGFPLAQLLLEVLLGGFEVAVIDVPAVVAVEHDHVEQVPEQFLVRGVEHDVDVAHGPGGVQLPGQLREGLRSTRGRPPRNRWVRWRCDQITTEGWFLSRATSSVIACRWLAAVLASTPPST